MAYLLDLTLLDVAYIAFKPSYIAAAALCYANVLTGPEPWTKQMENFTGRFFFIFEKDQKKFK